MRKIKFRAFDFDLRVMLEAEDDIAYEYTIGFDGTFKRDRQTDDRVELMQYTGNTDKVGKEIYEGDIVEFLPLSSSSIDTGFVIYYNDGFYIQAKTRMKRLYEEVFGQTKVIGNIHENPELLKA